MSEVVSSYVTVSCDGPECDKTVTFLQTQEDAKKAFADNTWMNSIRSIQTVDGQKFVYCSDECEIKAAGQGVHNKKQIVVPQAPNAIDLAAQAAARAQQATQALKTGEGKVTLG